MSELERPDAPTASASGSGSLQPAAARRSVGGDSAAANPGPVVVLAGGTGGAKLARGMFDVVGPDELVVIANTGDDIDIYGAHVSPDPDLVSFWLADIIDERGWGLRGDTFAVMDALRALRREVWFKLGDRDLAWCLERRRMEDEGLRPTEALARLNEAIGVRTRVLPMCDEPLRTWVRSEAGWRDFQQFMIRDRAEGPVREVAFVAARDGRGAPARSANATPPNARPSDATPRMADPAPAPTPEVLAALAGARAVIVSPSNPVISVWPILHVLGDALAKVTAPIVCVSPVVGGEIVKGPTAAFLAAYKQSVDAAGVVAFYQQVAPGLLDGIVADEAPHGPSRALPALRVDTLMDDPAARARVAARALRFALSLAG